MILEWLESAITPCAKPMRDLGYRVEMIAIGARYRRCRPAWAQHLARSRRAVETAMARARGRDTAMILGSGRLLDLPLDALASAFRRVVLVDALHPLSARLIARRYANVELWSEDVTGTIAALHRLKRGDPLPTARSFAPMHRREVDLVVSLNLLSQLGVLAAEWVERRLGDAAIAEAFAASLVRAHLDDLARCPVTVCLISDVEWQNVGANGAILERESSIFGVVPPPAAEEWIWDIAPAPECDPVISERRRVIVAYDPGKPPAEAGG